MKKVLSKTQEEFLCWQRIKGKKIRELAQEWHIGVGTVHSILKRHGVGVPEQNSPMNKNRRRRQSGKEDNRSSTARKEEEDSSLDLRTT